MPVINQHGIKLHTVKRLLHIPQDLACSSMINSEVCNDLFKCHKCSKESDTENASPWLTTYIGEIGQLHLRRHLSGPNQCNHILQNQTPRQSQILSNCTGFQSIPTKNHQLDVPQSEAIFAEVVKGVAGKIIPIS